MFLPLAAFEHIVDYVAAVRTDTLSSFEPLAAVAGALAAGFAVFHLVISSGRIMSGQKFSLWELVKPFVMLILIIQFNNLVVRPLDTIVGTVDAGISSIAFRNGTGDFDTAVVQAYVRKQQAEDRLEAERRRATGKNYMPVDTAVYAADEAGNETVDFMVDNYEHTADTGGSFLDRTSDFFSGMWKRITEAISGFYNRLCQNLICTFATCIFWLFSMICTVVKVFSNIYLLLLAVFGPYVFAFAMFPGHDLKGSVVGWVDRYIQVSLWPALVSLVYILVSSIATKSFDHVASDSYGGDSELGVSLSISMVCSCMMVISVAGMIFARRVKDISKIVLQGDGDGGMGGLGSMMVDKAEEKAKEGAYELETRAKYDVGRARDVLGDLTSGNGQRSVSKGQKKETLRNLRNGMKYSSASAMAQLVEDAINDEGVSREFARWLKFYTAGDSQEVVKAIERFCLKAGMTKSDARPYADSVLKALARGDSAEVDSTMKELRKKMFKYKRKD